MPILTRSLSAAFLVTLFSGPLAMGAEIDLGLWMTRDRRFTETKNNITGQIFTRFRWTTPHGIPVNKFTIYRDGAWLGWQPDGGRDERTLPEFGLTLIHSDNARNVIEASMDEYLAIPHTYKLECTNFWGEDYYEIFEYVPPHILDLEYYVEGMNYYRPYPLQLKHSQEGTEGYDSTDLETKVKEGIQFISTVNFEDRIAKLACDDRPFGSTSDYYIQTRFVTFDGQPTLFEKDTLNQMRLLLPGKPYQTDFGPSPITIQQYNPEDPSQKYPTYNGRELVERNDGVIPLPDLIGSYPHGIPFLYFKISFSHASHDVDDNGVFNFHDYGSMANNWMAQLTTLPEDIAQKSGFGLPDGNIDWHDLMYLCQNWSGCREGFELGKFDFVRFESGRWSPFSETDWVVVSSEKHVGRYSAKTADIDKERTSTLTLEITRVKAGTISFWYRLSSQNDSNTFRFKIGAEVKAEWSGNTGWEKASFPIKAGTHVLYWDFQKDRSGRKGDGTVWIDDIVLPPSQANDLGGAGE